MKKRIFIPLCVVMALSLAPLCAGLPTQTPAAQTATSDRLQANQSIQQADAMVANVTGLIDEFTVSDRLSANDSRLVPIVQMRDLAVKFIANSNGLYAGGAYTSARDSATEALGSATEAWNLALALKAELSRSPTETAAVTTPSTPVPGSAAATTGAPTGTGTPVPAANTGASGGTDLLSQIIAAFQRFLKLFGI